MILSAQMTLPAMVVDSFASFKGDSAATGTPLLAGYKDPASDKDNSANYGDKPRKL
jgi:hypothetical protein